MLVQDNTTLHTGIYTWAFLDEEEIDAINSIARSPDLNTNKTYLGWNRSATGRQEHPCCKCSIGLPGCVRYFECCDTSASPVSSGAYRVAWRQTRALYYKRDLTLSQSVQPMAVQKAVLSLAASAQRAHAWCRTIFCLEDIDHSVWCSYNAVSFLQSPRELPINRPLGWVVVCLLWVQTILPSWRTHWFE